MPRSPAAAPPASGDLRIQYPAELPISARVHDIAAAIAEHPVVIVAGATGSGKTTQLPKIALELGRGSAGSIGVTQPRRIAATSVAARVASELDCALGGAVGYQIRFERRAGPETRLTFMTDGILLAEIQGDELLRRYDTLIIDEAHERSLTIDFLLGWLRRILPRRPDLKLLISSATLETERFSAFFGNAPVIEVEGRTYPVDVLYEPPDPEIELSLAVARAVENVTSLDPRGDILVFLPGEREIREAEQALAGLELRHTTVQPLYGRLSAADQNKVFARISGRRVILATNVAETSLTIPGIVYVIDTGLARLSRYDPTTGTTRLQIEGISQASANQRKGRCGRVREGICVRLYDEAGFVTRPEFTDPEIKRTGLAGVILRMKSLRLGSVEDFPFLDAPHPRSISEGYRVLEELGALDEKRELTPLGARLAQFPVDPRIARMVLAGAELGCREEVLTLAAALGIQDPRERPRGAEQKADELHRRFRDERSDFVALLRLWEFTKAAREQSQSELRRVCKANFLSFTRVREWAEVRRQLAEIMGEIELGKERGGARRRRSRPDPTRSEPRGADARGSKPRGPEQRGPEQRGARARGQTKPEEDTHAALHRALLSGLLSRIGQFNPEARAYTGARQTRFLIHPASGLAKKPPAWVMAFELVQTTQLFARHVAKIDPEWLDEMASHLLKRSFTDPHWSEKSARARIKEHATLFGLPVFRDRRVDYARVAPVRARLMFIEHALVRGEYQSRGAFQAHNREIVAEAARLRDKARQSDLVSDEEALVAFFDRHLPEGITNGTAFETWRQNAERKDPQLLCLALSDVLVGESALDPAAYPDVLTIHGVELPLSYRFDPSAEDDGISVALPLALLPQLDPAELDGTIPAWQREQVLALLEGLPRALRRELGSVPELAAQIVPRLRPFAEPFLPALGRALFEVSGLSLPPEALRLDALPPYLRPYFRVLGERGSVVAQSRDLRKLLDEHAPRARAALKSEAPGPRWERSGLVRWDFGELPEHVMAEVLGARVRRYPALIDRRSSVDLTLLESRNAAEAATLRGVERLLALRVQKQLAALAKRVPPPLPRTDGLPASRADVEAFREAVLGRALREAFGLGSGRALPRAAAGFEALLAAGLPRLDPAFERVARAVAALASELDKTERALRGAASQPSGTQAARDIRAQLDALLPTDWLDTIELERLEQYPRYARAAQTRLARAIVDPRKDADKFATFAPLWTSYLERRSGARDAAAVAALRWAFEELRVAIFAPEIKAASGINLASVTRALAALG